MIEAWLAAPQRGDIAALLTLLDDDAVLRADYGTSTQVVDGAVAIAEQAVLSARLAAHSTLICIGRRPGVAAVLHGRVVSIMAFELTDDRIIGLEVLADPARLDELGARDVIPGIG